MQKAIDKARNLKLLARVASFGSYTVSNKWTGATCTVTWEKRNGEQFAACDCKAGAANGAITSRLPPGTSRCR